jgi:DNA-binding transcriptional MocR family regulator
MFLNIKITGKMPIYLQIYNSIKEMIDHGILPLGSKLPSSRELAHILNVGRMTVITAYEMLAADKVIYTLRGKGTYICKTKINNDNAWSIDWSARSSELTHMAESMDIMKHEFLYKKGMISFKSIAPDESLFDIDEIKRSFLNLISLEGGRILNYGYAKGYKPLIEYLLQYMAKRGIDIEGKSIIITNGFTEAYDLILSAITEKGDYIICENPTHNTAIKQMKLHGLNILGISLNKDGIDTKELEAALEKHNVKAAYLVPSYHNPTGMVMSYERRKLLFRILKTHNVPIIEDGFTEELQHLSSHIAPIAAISGKGNSVIYIGSFSKILFPGMRIGWIFGDNSLMDLVESLKRSVNIHTSFLDQGILYHYLLSGSFDKYIKKVRNIYSSRYELAKSLAQKYLPLEYILGDGGLYLFIKLKNIDARELLKNCCKRGVIFTPGDIFYTDSSGSQTLRIGFSRTSLQEIKDGMKIIGEEANILKNK